MTADARGLVETLAGKLFHGEPLSSTQGTRLAELLTSNASTNRPDEWLRRQAFAGESNIITWTDVDWEAVLGRAGEILTPSQLFTLRALASDARLRRDIEQRLREADQRGRDSVRGRKPG